MKSNSHWIVLTAIVLLPSLANAQRTSQYGIKAGMNVASFHGKSDFVGSAILGYHAGVYYRRHIGDLITLRPEVYYSLEGTVFKSTSRGQYNYAAVPSTTTVHKLNVPVLIEAGRKITLDLGAQLGLLLAANNTTDSPPAYIPDTSQNLDDKLAWGDFSVVGGIGFHPRRHFDASVRYNHGLSRIFEPSAFPQIPARQSDFRSGVLQATIGYSF